MGNDLTWIWLIYVYGSLDLLGLEVVLSVSPRRHFM